MQEEPTYQINFQDQIEAFDFSTYEESDGIACIALKNKLVIGEICCPRVNEVEIFDWIELRTIYHEHRCDAIAISPESVISTRIDGLTPQGVKVAVAGSDYKIRIYSSDLNQVNTVLELNAHISYINTLAWEPYGGTYLASGSDDHTFAIWDKEAGFQQKVAFNLRSAVMTVQWHITDLDKLLVAEKQGTIHMYKIQTQQLVLSIETRQSPLVNADWCQINRHYVTALVAGDLITYDLRRPVQPCDRKSVHENVGRIVKFSLINDNVMASVGRPNNTMKIMHMKTKLPQFTANMRLFAGLCWHHKLPFIMTANDNKLQFWKVDL